MARGGCLLLVASLSAAAHAQLLAGAPIWCASPTSLFALLRAPDFVLRAPTFTSATLYFAALGSPRPPEGTTQAKLLGAAAVYVNGVLASVGPGHNVPTASQVVRGLDVAPFLRGGGAANALGIASFFDRADAKGAVPRVQAVLAVIDAQGSYNVSATGPQWSAWAADIYFNPTGNAGISWYPMSNEFLDRRFFPLGWALPGFESSWPSAVTQPAWTLPLYFERGAPPTTLVRSACTVRRVSATRQILDFGQEMMGGPNLTFAAGQGGVKVTVVLAEELLGDGSVVLSPLRTGNRWNSTWTLSGAPGVDVGIHQHEFVQFRFAQVDTSATDTFVAGSAEARAWVVQHPNGGDGANKWDSPCSAAVPAATAFGTGTSAATPTISWASSSSALDTVFNFSAYTIVATSLDVNVDGQTRERDIDVVDALNTELGQFYVFSPGDTSIQRRTLLEMQTNDTGMWAQWYDFKASSVMNVHDYVLFTGDVELARQVWSDRDDAILADENPNYNSVQFEAGLRYFNGSGNGLLHFSPSGSCGGSWACEPLIDWPTSTRDGYDCSTANYEDTGRSALGAMAYSALASLGRWLNKPAAAARYAAMDAAVRASLRRLNMRTNGSEAFFVDGAAGASASHAAVHSTLYAISAGAADGDAALGAALAAFLRRHGVAPSSCMMGRWWVAGLLRLGAWSPEAADLALDVLTSPSYPGWLDMLKQGATTTMEAWRPADKSNLDWAHPWCASPSFAIPAGILGAEPVAPGWAEWRLVPQASNLTFIVAEIPTPSGMVPVSYFASWSAGANATVALSVLPGQACTVCLALPGVASVVAELHAAAGADALTVDGAPVSAVPLGRFLCTSDNQLLPGPHVVSRVLSA